MWMERKAMFISYNKEITEDDGEWAFSPLFFSDDKKSFLPLFPLLTVKKIHEGAFYRFLIERTSSKFYHVLSQRAQNANWKRIFV